MHDDEIARDYLAWTGNACATMCAANPCASGTAIRLDRSPIVETYEAESSLVEALERQQELAAAFAEHDQEQVRWRALGQPRDLREQGTEEAFRRGRGPRKTIWKWLSGLFQSEY